MVLAGLGDAWIRFLGARDSARLAPASLPANPITRPLTTVAPPFLSRSVSWNLASYAGQRGIQLSNVHLNYIIATCINRQTGVGERDDDISHSHFFTCTIFENRNIDFYLQYIQITVFYTLIFYVFIVHTRIKCTRDL